MNGKSLLFRADRRSDFLSLAVLLGALGIPSGLRAEQSKRVAFAPSEMPVLDDQPGYTALQARILSDSEKTELIYNKNRNRLNQSSLKAEASLKEVRVLLASADQDRRNRHFEAMREKMVEAAMKVMVPMNYLVAEELRFQTLHQPSIFQSLPGGSAPLLKEGYAVAIAVEAVHSMLSALQDEKLIARHRAAVEKASRGLSFNTDQKTEMARRAALVLAARPLFSLWDIYPNLVGRSIWSFVVADAHSAPTAQIKAECIAEAKPLLSALAYDYVSRGQAPENSEVASAIYRSESFLPKGSEPAFSASGLFDQTFYLFAYIDALEGR